jgi:hypothetical protein
MNCAEFQDRLPDLMEGERDAQCQAHLATCVDCAELASDLNAIAEQAHLLPADVEPSPRVWAALETQLRREGLIREPKPDHRLFVLRPHKRWTAAAWLAPIAAALVIAALMLLSTDSSKTAKSPPPSGPTVVNPEAVQDAEIMAEVQKNAPAMHARYEENLRHINQYLDDARRSVKENPDDADAREYLLQASEQKAMLYQMALERSLP